MAIHNDGIALSFENGQQSTIVVILPSSSVNDQCAVLWVCFVFTGSRGTEKRQQQSNRRQCGAHKNGHAISVMGGHSEQEQAVKTVSGLECSV